MYEPFSPYSGINFKISMLKKCVVIIFTYIASPTTQFSGGACVSDF